MIKVLIGAEQIPYVTRNGFFTLQTPRFFNQYTKNTLIYYVQSVGSDSE